MDKKEVKELREKILKGIALSYERLLEQKKREDGELIFADKDGKIITVKARDL
jgi:hypothetical protein